MLCKSPVGILQKRRGGLSTVHSFDFPLKFEIPDLMFFSPLFGNKLFLLQDMQCV